VEATQGAGTSAASGMISRSFPLPEHMIKDTLSTLPGRLCLLLGMAWPLNKIDIGTLFAFGLDLDARTTAVVSALAALLLASWINDVTKPHLRLEKSRWMVPLLGGAAALAFAFEFGLIRHSWIVLAAGRAAPRYVPWALDIAVLCCIAAVTTRLEAPWWLRGPIDRGAPK